MENSLPKVILTHGECLAEMAEIPDNYIDMVMCDLPYGTTACKWDSIIDLPSLWAAYKRVLRMDGAAVFTASQPFTTALAASNMESFAYAWVWDKKFAGNFVQAKRMPLRTHEDVLVFCFSGKTPRYFPQVVLRDVPIKKGGNKQSEAIPIRQTDASRDFGAAGKSYDTKMPVTILEYSNRTAGDRGQHPTQKPVALMEYLIRTYTNPGDVVLDNCMGSGTTGVACVNTGRSFIGIEQDAAYFKIASERIAAAQKAKR